MNVLDKGIMFFWVGRQEIGKDDRFTRKGSISSVANTPKPLRQHLARLAKGRRELENHELVGMGSQEVSL
jgi:hypothetical protein